MKEMDFRVQGTADSHEGTDGAFGKDYWDAVSKGDQQPASAASIAWWFSAAPEIGEQPVVDEALDEQIRSEFRDRMNDPTYDWES